MTPQRALYKSSAILGILIGLASSAAYGQARKSNVGVFRQGFLWVLDADGNEQLNSPPDLVVAFGGVPGDIPISGDWNGDGYTKIGIYRPSNGLFILDSNGDGQLDAGDAVFNLHIGTQAGDIPVVGDWNGDGRSKVGYFRQGFLWILDYNGNGVYEPGVDKSYVYGGVAGDLPVVGDWTGTGTGKIGIYRQGGLWILDANGNGTQDATDPVFGYGGIAGDLPVVGDWTGTGTSNVGIFRQGFLWILDANGNRIEDAPDPVFSFGGVTGDVPVVGKWNVAEGVETEPVCVSSSGSCTAPLEGQLPVLATNVVQTAQGTGPFYMLTAQFTNAQGVGYISGGQILVNVDTTTPPAGLNGCNLTWNTQKYSNLYMPDSTSNVIGSAGGNQLMAG